MAQEAELDDILRQARGQAPPPDPPPSRKLIIDDDLEEKRLHDAGLVSGSFARTMVPRIKEKASFDDILRDAREASSKGYKPGKKALFLQAKDVNGINSKELDFDDILEEARENTTGEVTLGVQEASSGDRLLTRFGDAGKDLLTALSADEHAIVKTIYALTGVGRGQEKEFSDYTWTNLLRDSKVDEALGFEEWQTESMGLAAAIFLSPSTYLTFGTGAAAKIGAKVALSPRGIKAVSALVARESAKEIMNKNRLIFKQNMSRVQEDVIRTRIKRDVNQEVLKRFGEINSLNKTLKISASIRKGVRELPESVKSLGGAKFNVPFIGEKKLGLGIIEGTLKKTRELYKAADVKFFGKVVMNGDEVLLEGAKAGVPQFLISARQTAALAGKAFDDKKVAFLKTFMVNYGINKNLLQVFRNAGEDSVKLLKNPGGKFNRADVEVAFIATEAERFQKSAIRQRRVHDKQLNGFFKGLNTAEREEFGDMMIKLSVKSGQRQKELAQSGVREADRIIQTRRIFALEAVSKNPKVQDAIDRWLGQGKFVKTKSLMEDLAGKSKLMEGVEGEELGIWFPGVIEQRWAPKKEVFKLTTGQRKFLKERIEPSLADKYTRDPVRALAVRMGDIADANLQDKFWDRLKELKIGNPVVVTKKTRDSLKAAGKLDGKVPLKKPKEWQVDFEGTDLSKLDPETIFVDKNVFDKYLATVSVKPIGKFQRTFGPFTGMWKANVTQPFLPFHIRNATSNIILNALRIGGHAFSPTKHFDAMGLVARRNVSKETVPFTKGIVKRTAFGTAVGGGTGALINTEDGEHMGVAGAAIGGLAAFGLSDQTYKAFVRMVWGDDLGKVAIKDNVGRSYTLQQVIDTAEETGAIGRGFYTADIVGKNLDKTLGDIWGSTFRQYVNPLSPDWVPAAFGQKMGDAIETQARLVNYMAWLSRGLTPEKAAVEVAEALFDYHAITGFERMLNSTIIPFYTFSRKNLENHYKLMKHRPGVIINQFKFLREMGPTAEEIEDMPPHAKDQYLFKFNDLIFGGFGAPLEDIIQLSGGLGRQSIGETVEDLSLRLNPVLRYGAERFFDKDIFSNRSIAEANNANEFKFLHNLVSDESTPSFIREALRPVQEFLSLQPDPGNPDKLIGNGDVLHLLRSSFSSRYQSVLGQLQKEDKGPFEKSIRFVTGFVRYEVNPDLAAIITEKVGRQRLDRIITKLNLGKFVTGKKPGSRFFLTNDDVVRDTVNYYYQMIQEGKEDADVIFLKEVFKEAEEEFRALNKELVELP